MLASQPLVVLVDENSASATEILTGALKDNHRATIIGKKTFGKGVIQEVVPIQGGAVLYVTSARYVTPSGKSIHKIGITPDITKDPNEEEIQTAVHYLDSQPHREAKAPIRSGNSET